MGRRDDNLEQHGPEPRFGAGAEMVHSMIHERAIGKTIAAVYVGDNDPFVSMDPENAPPDGIFRSEYLAFEFTDGAALVLQVGAGNSFHPATADDTQKILKRAHEAAEKRAHLEMKVPEHESEGQALTEASQTDE
jgi:hypothetical protein